ncbi:MAG: hypothetical protein K2P94_05285 [Rhodospirillaceae bacterium]|nr:hypothetical protein [Rhodospirillaceae bacterium]
MTGLVLGWIGVAAILFTVIAQPWRSPAARAPLPMILSVTAGAWGVWDGVVTYQDLIARGAWTAAAIVIPYVLLKILAYAVLAYAVGRAALSATPQTAPRRYILPASLAAVLLVALGADIRASFDAAKIRTARSQTLTPGQIAAIAARIDGRTALEAETFAFLENPLCPPEFLHRHAGGPPLFRAYIARNPNAPADLLLTFSEDADPQVRYSAVYNANMPASELPRMAMDADAMVRESVVWKKALPDDSFARLLEDAVPRVRAAAALQPRITDAALMRLTEDADPGVRANATRIAVQRGLKE